MILHPIIDLETHDHETGCGRDLRDTERRTMTITVAHIQPIISLLSGILILIIPRLLNYIVAVYLILAGLLGLGLLG
jgi:hypothetical protein